MKKLKRVARHLAIRKKVYGQGDRPRLVVFKSNQHIYAQIIDDAKQHTLAQASDLKLKGTKSEKALLVGETVAKAALAKKVKRIVFDRGGFRYHGRIKALAEGARKGGLEF